MQATITHRIPEVGDASSALNIPPNGRKRGRPQSESLAAYSALFPEWSERTIARYDLAMRRLNLMGIDGEEFASVIKLASRANGSINVARLVAITESMASMWVARLAPNGGNAASEAA